MQTCLREACHPSAFREPHPPPTALHLAFQPHSDAQVSLLIPEARLPDKGCTGGSGKSVALEVKLERFVRSMNAHSRSFPCKAHQSP